MTAEIAIINRTGIALAADSAVTIRRDRVWKGSNKLFHLAPCADVGVMIYGSDSHCALPWEIIIKQYRKRLGRKTFARVQQYADDFLLFLDELETPHPIQSDMNIYSLMLGIIEEAKPPVNRAKTKTARRKEFISVMSEIVKIAESYPIIFDDYSLTKFSEQYSRIIKELLEEEEELDVLVTKPVLSSAITACYEVTRRAYPSGGDTGIVFAGFGDSELLPVLLEMTIDGTLDKKVRAWTVRVRNANETDPGGRVIPFAQSDIAHLVIEGLLPDYIEYSAKTIKGILDAKTEKLIKDYVPTADQLVEKAKQLKANEAMTQKFVENFKDFRHKVFVEPMMEVVGSLPKEEMAALAEALVETTSLRRKMDSRLETVGGPVDVAIISKADGFVWIKRKHYFDIELNRDFLQRREERYSGEN